MNWLLLISVFIVIPSVVPKEDSRRVGSVRVNSPRIQINRDIDTVPDRKFMEYDQNDPDQVMRALNSLPGPSEQLDINEYVRLEKARIEKKRAEHPEMNGIKLPYENFDISKLNQSAIFYIPNNNTSANYRMSSQYRKMSDYVKAAMERAIHRDRAHDPELIKRRSGHHNNGGLPSMKELAGTPDLEAMLPADYLAKHKHDFHRFKGSTGKNVPKIKNPYLEDKEPAMLFAEMGSMKNLRKSSIDNLVENYLQKKRSQRNNEMNDLRRTSKIDDLVDTYLRKRHPGRYNNEERRSYHTQKKVPVLTREQLNHPGNALFYITEKRILGAHTFPKKEAEHSVYGNLESLGLNVYPTSEEVQSKKLKKLYRETPPDAQDRPWRLYNPNHPGLSLLYDKNMPLDAAKFTKPKDYLVYGNLNNLGERSKDNDRYAYSDTRRYNVLRRSQFFQRPNNGRFNTRPQNGFDSDEQHFRRPKWKHRPIWKRPGRKVQSKPSKSLVRRPKPKVLAKIYIGRSGTTSNITKLKSSNKEAKTKETKGKENPSRLVYGNIDNDMLGIRYGKAPFRWKYTNFRKDNRNKLRLHRLHESDLHRPEYVANYDEQEADNMDIGLITELQQEEDNVDPGVIKEQDDDKDTETLLSSVLQANQKVNRMPIKKRNSFKKYGKLSNRVAILPADLRNKNIKYHLLKDYLAGKIPEEDDNSNELLDSYEEDSIRWRRSSKGRDKYTSYEKREKRKNDTLCPDPSSSSSSSESSKSGERNPGNPYTIFKSKYKQNWLWNHFMDGDHMNVNPYGPKFDSLGPTGNELFFGRKWWYFNQDDYKPFRRR